MPGFGWAQSQTQPRVSNSTDNWTGSRPTLTLTIPAPACGNIRDAHLQLILDDGAKHLKSSSFSTALTVTISYSGSNATETKTLTIRQDAPEMRAVLLPTIAAGSGLTVNATVSGVTDTGTPPVNQQRLRLVATPEIEMDPASLASVYNNLQYSTRSTSATGFDQTLSWSACAVATNYQIRLVHRPWLQGSTRTPATPSDAEAEQEGLLLETGSLVPNNGTFSYPLALAQGQGVYFWQVRPIGNKPGGVANPANLPAWSTDFVVIYLEEAPEADRNWIYSRTFTEDGRVAEKLTFANGLQQVRQTQTRLAVPGVGTGTYTRRLLATQTLQDYAGRDAVTSLPIPLLGSYSFHYADYLLTTSASTSTNPKAYGPAQFDAGAAAAEPEVARQPGESAGTHYYSGVVSASGANPGGRVADAQGYPFTRIIFTNDGTNRVTEQGGVGAVMRVRPAGVGLDEAPRTVRTYYMGVTPEEIYRLFGAESPEPSSVSKILTLDPNNTPSVTYKTKEGQTIATALSLVSQGDTARVRHLHTAGSTFQVKEHISGRSQVISKTITVTASPEEAIHLEYELTPPQLSSCVNYCSTCDYVVKIRVVQVNPEPVAGTANVLDESVSVIQSASCTVAASTFKKDLSLKPGTYRIERELVPFGNQSSSTTPVTGGRTLADHLALIQATLGTALTAAPWPAINQFLDNKDIEGLYTALEQQNYPKVTENGATYYVLPITANGCSESVRLPLLTNYCGEPCVLADFAPQAFEQLETALKTLNDTYSGTSYSSTDVVPGYDNSQLAKLLTNMGDDGYDCKLLRDCFRSEISSLEPNFYLPANVPNGYTYDFIRGFLQCTGLHLQQITTKAVDPTLAYAQFQLDPDNVQHQQCLVALLGHIKTSVDPTQFDLKTPSANTQLVLQAIDDLNNLADPDRKNALTDLYQCLSSSIPYNPGQQQSGPLAEAAAATLSQQCLQVCEDRRAEFEAAIITQFHLQGIAVAGDTYLYHVSATQVPVLTGKPVTSSTPLVERCQIQLLAQELINNCGKSCQVDAYDATGNGGWAVGTPAQLHAVELAMTHGFDLTVQDLQNGGSAKCDSPLQPVTKIAGNLLENATLSSGAQAVMNSVSALARSVEKLQARPSAGTPLGCGLPGGIGERLSGQFFQTAQVDPDSWPSDPTCTPGTPLPQGATYGVTVVDNRDRSTTYLWKYFDRDTDFLLDWQDKPYSGCQWQTNSFGWDKCGPILKSTKYSDYITPYYRIRFLDDNGNPYQKREIREISAPYLNLPLALPLPNTKPAYAVTSQDVKVRILLHDGDGVDRWVIANVDAQGYIEQQGHISSLLNPLTWKNVTQCEVKDNSRYAMCFAWHTQLDTVAVPLDSAGVFTGTVDCRAVAARQIRNAITAGQQTWVERQLEAFTTSYTSKCLAFEGLTEDFTLTYDLGYYHYTLYYYDRGGNLMRTVPPAGVVPLSATQVASMLPAQPGAAAPDRSTWPLTTHTLPTTYTYNSLHQLVRQNTPDGGLTRFFYNAKGQLRFSQNAKQAANKAYSYTRYDALGRVTEVGESPYDANGTSSSLTLDNIVANAQVMAYPDLAKVPARYITRTVYSVPMPGLAYPGTGTAQRNLLNRVSYSWTDADPATTADDVYTYYSYDAHGNVEWLCQQQDALGQKFVRYDYDLVSNKVLRVNYQEGQADQFYHRYGYDPDNRLTEVYTSTDGVIWDQDARYQYYAHGPLQRLELGQDRVQGLDYTYTLQGWLKAINHPAAALDPGQDGTAATGTGQDAFSMALGYHAGDYVGAWNASAGQASLLTPANNLYNGNIASWTTKTRTEQLSLASVPAEPVMGERYRYDELNRLVGSQMHTNSGSSFIETQNFKTLYAYDANGNLRGLRRQGNAAVGPDNMDQLTYAYTSGTNRLRRVDDAVPASGAYDDVKPVSSLDDTFGYDEIGNLVRDDASRVSSIEWTVYGKPARVTSSGQRVSYGYDAAGNRVSKRVAPTRGTGGTAVYYVRDATGNVLAVYEQALGGKLVPPPVLVEQPIYGSARLGERLTRGQSLSVSTTDLYARAVGQKRYELSDHLGNVRAVVTDELVGVEQVGTGSAYQPDLQAYASYYAFGMEQPGRTNPGNATLAGGYRYGYNGKEKDNNGEFGLTHYDYGFRIYNPGLGRFLSVDPLTAKYPMLTPYQFASNTPIAAIDLDGLEALLQNIRRDNNVMLVITKSNQENTALRKDYQAAIKAGVAVMLVNNTSDFKDGLSRLKKADVITNTFVISSHGNNGSFRVGEEEINSLFFEGNRGDANTKRFEELSSYLRGTTVVISACNTGRGMDGLDFTQFIADELGATVITSKGTIPGGYNYDGGQLASDKIVLPTVKFFNPNGDIIDFKKGYYAPDNGNFLIANPKEQQPKEVSDVTIDKKSPVIKYEKSDKGD